ncbi:beta-taxilin-like isoform X2 [Xyrauchen texanus]|uniref:beta-taxilin-like isoform X2 n=1 Tax=Xyrauchen texanus TaxID=154827 RepID=UPI002242420D|nr:beta-taxilin-like isoform X2 [Xyrauchen texanus]
MMEGSGQTSENTIEQVNGTEEQPTDPMEVFSRQLEDIINTYGSASSLMEEQISILETKETMEGEEDIKADEEAAPKEAEASQMKEQKTDNKLLKGLGKEATSLLQSLNKLSSPEDKVEMVLKKYTEMVEEHRSEKKQLEQLLQRQGLLVKQRDQLQFEHSRAILARSKLELLCRELQRHNSTLKEESLQRQQEDDLKRKELTTHFQSTLVDIQAQIEQHSSRNNKLCHENNELANKLKTIVDQYELREQSLEKIFKNRDLQQKLSDVKLEEANMLLNEAVEKHNREKEYLLKEAIEKTKKCYAMREQELQMKKQLVLYSQKFDEFQVTLAKSNEIYATFKQQMDKMTKKMTKLEKESNTWKTRFESSNKALVDMIEERSEKAKEFELFTLKIDRLETLCQALQDERKVLYTKIKEIRLPDQAAPAPAVDTPQEDEFPELVQPSMPAPNPSLTAEMMRLREEQTRLQEFAASLVTPITADIGESDSEEEEVSESRQEVLAIPEVPQPEPTKQADKSVFIQEETSTTEENKPQVVGVNEDKPLPTELEPAQTETESKPPQEPPQPETTEQQTGKQKPAQEEPSQEQVAKIEPIKQETIKQESTKPEPVIKEEAIQDENKFEAVKSELPEVDSTKQEPIKEEDVQKEEAAEAQAAKPKAPKSHEVKPKASKPQPKKQGPAKKKGSAKGVKKS